MYNGSRAHFAIYSGRVFAVLGRRGHLISAISGIDMALWDILGKSLGVPVWRLLGGRRKESYPAYASGGWAPVDRIVEELQSFVDRGNFKAVKMRVGAQDDTVNATVERVRAARKHLGPDVDIMVDAHCTFTSRDARR
ncbi:MAG: enolase C-terminal domain-like protein, partial [Rickettsiales bacterium]